MPEPHFEGLRSYTENALRQPEFAAIRTRARRVRRRRAVASGAAVVAAVLAVTGIGYAAAAGPNGGRPQVADSEPAADPDKPQMSDVVATSPNDLYGLLRRCVACGPELFASKDAGATWQPRELPPPIKESVDPRDATLVALGPGVLAWQERRRLTIDEVEKRVRELSPGGTPKGLWITLDDGRTWQPSQVATKPVAAIPAGTRAVDCGLVGQTSPCKVYAVDPATGRFAPLAVQPSGISLEPGAPDLMNVPLGGSPWVTGLDPATRKPALATSTDGGRSWRTHVFTDGVKAVSDEGFTATMYLPSIAAGAGGLVYALTYHSDTEQVPHRSTDGGKTWTAGPPVPQSPDAGFVTTDGAHVIKNGAAFLSARNGSDYRPVTLAGYPQRLLSLTQVTAQSAPGRYLVNADELLATSDDGRTWRRLKLPR